MDNATMSTSIDICYNSPKNRGTNQNSDVQQDARALVLCGSSNSNGIVKTNCGIERENNMAIVELPRALQSEEYQVARVHTESPNNTLHDILIHKPVYSETEELANIKGVDGTIISESNEEQIYMDADLSPRVIKAIKSARNGKKQGDGESAKPLRVQPKRQVISQYSRNK